MLTTRNTPFKNKAISDKMKGNKNGLGNKSRAGQKQSKEERDKKRQAMKGETNYLWKGENVSYSGLHHWLKRWFGKPSQCEFCGVKGKKYTYANKSGKYSRKRSDYLELCYSCHKLFDLKRKK